MRREITLILSLLIVSGCSKPEKPTETFVRKSFIKSDFKQFGEFAELVNFKKINGAEFSNFFSGNGYAVAYKATIKYVKDCWKYRDFLTYSCSKKKPKFTPHKPIFKRKGDVDELTGRIIYRKTDKGWAGKNGEVY